MNPIPPNPMIEEAYAALERLMQRTLDKRRTKARVQQYREVLGWYYATLGVCMWEHDRKGIPIDGNVRPMEIAG